MNGLENTAWLRLSDGDTHVLPVAQAVFNYNRADTLQTWAIHTTDGQLRVQFTPEGERSESIHIGAMYSHFTQPFGAFSGVWVDEQGHERALTGIGVVEQHRALW